MTEDNDRDDKIVFGLIVKGYVKARELEPELERATSKSDVYRRLDRSLQRLRRAGKITYSHGEWSKAGK